MNNLKDVYVQCISAVYKHTHNSDGVMLVIKYSIDLITAVNNVPTSKDYNANVPFVSGICYMVKASAPNGLERTFKCLTNEDVIKAVSCFDDPNNAFYRENPLQESQVCIVNSQDETMTFILKAYGAGYTKKGIVFSKGSIDDFGDDNIQSVFFNHNDLSLSGGCWRNVVPWDCDEFYENVVFGKMTCDEFIEQRP